MAAERRVIVTRHAVTQAYKRRYPVGFSSIAKTIESEVRAALVSGRVSREKINGFRLYHSRNSRLANSQRFVWNDDGTWGWIVAREDAGDTVVTTLKNVGVHH
jgi:hypothetical protein